MINNFDKDNLKVLRIQIQNALNQVAQANGLESIQLKNISFTGTEFSSKIVAKTKGAKAKVIADFPYYGLPADFIGRTFVNGRSLFTITDFTPGVKYSVHATNQNGKSYRFPLTFVKDSLNLNK